jgi:hypothetical protein
VNLVPLTQQDYDEIFTPRAIPKALADLAAQRVGGSPEGAALIGASRPGDYNGIAIHNTLPGATAPRAYRLRRDHPDYEWKNGEMRPTGKYLSAPGSSNLAYFPPGTASEELTNTALPVVFTEGEFKGLALKSLAHYEAAVPLFLVAALNGIYGYRGKVAKRYDANGISHPVKGIIPDLDRIAMNGRLAYICFDTDPKPDTQAIVRQARTRLARELLDRGAADVRFVEIPRDAGLKGIDDVLAAWGPERVHDELFARAVSARARPNFTAAYFARDGRMWHKTFDRHGVEIETPLSNFEVQVIENRSLDNGIEDEAQLVYRMCGSINGSPPVEFDLPHERFKEPDWPEHSFGTKDAFTEPKAAELVRRAIAEISLGAARRTIYRHLGHRQIAGRHIYLCGPCAIGANGMVHEIQTSLSLELSRYDLRLPSSDDKRREAVRASLRIVDCAPHPITYPLIATAARAPLGPTPHVLALLGPSGALKSALAALIQQFFGPSMGWDGLAYHLPLNFSSTANSVAENLFLIKDAVAVVDDFAPVSDPHEMARRRNILERIVRDVGNQAGRGRLGWKPGGGVVERPVHPPRGTVIITGEDIVHTYSILGRTLLIEVGHDSVNIENLSQSQNDGAQGLFATCMGSYIQWLLGDFETRLQKFKVRVDELRTTFAARHRRTPGAAAELVSALELFLEFAVDVGAIDEVKRGEIQNEAMIAFNTVLQSQISVAAENDPAIRFRDLIRALVATQRAHFLSTQGGVPQMADTLGWRHDTLGNDSRWVPGGLAIGWEDGGDLYLDPLGSYAAAQRLASEQHEPLAITAQTLRKRLVEAKLTFGDQTRQRTTTRRTILGRSIPVLELSPEFLGK